jgi:hypothetical protein
MEEVAKEETKREIMVKWKKREGYTKAPEEETSK